MREFIKDRWSNMNFSQVFYLKEITWNEGIYERNLFIYKKINRKIDFYKIISNFCKTIKEKKKKYVKIWNAYLGKNQKLEGVN